MTPEPPVQFADLISLPHVYIFVCVMVFLYGAIIGSFLNVCIYRMPLGISVNRPARSLCFRCGSPIRWYDNVPVLSWFLLRGRDRACGAPFSPRYAFVEALSGCLHVWIFLAFNDPANGLVSPMSLWYMAFVSLLLVGIFTDFDHWVIPIQIPRWGTAAGILAALGAGFMDKEALICLTGPFPVLRLEWHDPFALVTGLLAAQSAPVAKAAAILWWEPCANAMFGAFFGYALLKSVGVIGKFMFGREAMGLGDADLFMLIGATMGAMNCLLILFLASVVGTILGGAPILLSSLQKAWARGEQGDPSPLRGAEWNEEEHQERERNQRDERLRRLEGNLEPEDRGEEESHERARALAESLQLPYLDWEELDKAATLDAFDAEEAIRLKAVPLRVSEKAGIFAVANPLNTELVAILRGGTGRNLQFRIAAETDLIRWLKGKALPIAREPEESAARARPLWRRYSEVGRLVPLPRRLHHLPFIPSIALAAFAILFGFRQVELFLRWLILQP